MVAFIGRLVSDLGVIEDEARRVLEDVGKTRKKMFESAVSEFVTKPTKEVRAIDKLLHHKLDAVMLRLRNPKNEIILGSLYDLQQKFGEVNVAELLVSSGLFSKVYYYHAEYHPYQDYKFETEADVENCIEACEGGGEKKYFDPIAGEQVSKKDFDENIYYTILPTSLYLKLYSELLEAYQNMKIC